MQTDTAVGVEILDRAECLRLLTSVPVGRLVFTQGGLPVVRLVTFCLDDETIVFASEGCEWLPAAQRGDVFAFEVDDGGRLGWTVTAVGHLSVVPAGEAEELEWAGFSDRALIRLGTESLTGRRAY